MTRATREVHYADIYRHLSQTVDVRQLEHCNYCWEPMYMVFRRHDGKKTRENCYWCDLAAGKELPDTEADLKICNEL